MEEQMKSKSISIVSFLLGALVSGLVVTKLAAQTSYEFVIGKLNDNVMFYRQIENGQPELTQKSIEISLDWFITLAEDGENSILVSSSYIDKQTLIRAKALQTQINDTAEAIGQPK